MPKAEVAKMPITVVSTYTTDVLLNERGEQLEVDEVGPARFIRNALENEDLQFDLIAGSPMTVEILVTSKGEFGKVPNRPTKRRIPAFTSDWVIISTVLDEWDVASITRWPARLFVDLQGYVRNGNDFGCKQQWDEVGLFADNVFCLKGTREEFEYIPKKIVEQQKQRMMVITDGSKGIELFYKGRLVRIPVHRLIGLKDTIGAGDTFMASLAAAMYKGLEPIEAVEYSSKMTARFLEENKVVGGFAA